MSWPISRQSRAQRLPLFFYTIPASRCSPTAISPTQGPAACLSPAPTTRHAAMLTMLPSHANPARMRDLRPTSTHPGITPDSHGMPSTLHAKHLPARQLPASRPSGLHSCLLVPAKTQKIKMKTWSVASHQILLLQAHYLIPRALPKRGKPLSARQSHPSPVQPQPTLACRF